jgi:cell division protein FtsB
MKTVKQTILRVFFALEMCVFLGLYLFGPSGFQSIIVLERENAELKFEIERLDEQTDQCRQKIAACQADSFYKEKIAREQLQMAREGDEVFLIG